MFPSFTVQLVCLALLALFVFRRFFQTKLPAPLPPGPKGLPLIGNVADMPLANQWLIFAEWGKKWGALCSVKLMGQTMIIVNSARILDELDKRGSIYSGRPRLEMAGELVGYAKTLVLIPYGARFRNYRRHVARLIGSSGVMQQFFPMEVSETHRFLKRVLANPESLSDNLRKTSGAIILRLTYGIEVQEGIDPYVTLIEYANSNFNRATVPGAFLVDFFPILHHIPEWLMPGGGFKATARLWAKSTSDMVEVPFAFVKKQMASGIAPISFVSRLLEDEDKLTADEVDDIKFTASSLYGGGADTIVSAQYAFFLAMTLYPDVLEKAQAEIDAVVGNDRLPGFSDRHKLPYLNGLVSEVLRWNSVAPTGVPHVAMEDGIVEGYFIPKDSVILANLWNILHDPEVYPDPFTFDPTRHIATPGKSAQRDPRHACFGYGRRICPGMHLAEASLFILIAMSLAVFDITKTVENGVPITPVHENTSGIISQPKPFKCTIRPRSAKAVSLIAADEA